jgi:hypothetical protein
MHRLEIGERLIPELANEGMKVLSKTIKEQIWFRPNRDGK